MAGEVYAWRIILFVMYYISKSYSQSEFNPINCAATCRCSVKEWHAPFPPFQTDRVNNVDCTGSAFSHMPRFPNNTAVLVLDNNDISNLSSVFGALTNYTNLQEVSLSNNQISSIQSFVKMPNLRRISLNDNKIFEMSTSFLKNFPNLNEISIQRNRIKSIANTSKAKMNELRSLRLDFNDIDDLKWIRNLTALPSINILSLGGNHLFGGFLAESVFSVLSQLTALIMGDMNISKLGRNVFCGLRNLQSLDLDNNKLLEVPTLALSKLTSLKHFTMKRNLISTVSRHTFINMTAIETIDLSNQPFLQFVDHEGFWNLPKLRTLLLANNPRLAFIAGDSFFGCPRVETLNLQNTMIEILDKKILTTLPAVRKIYLKNNPINCNCMMMWIKEWIPGKKLIKLYQTKAERLQQSFNNKNKILQ